MKATVYFNENAFTGLPMGYPMGYRTGDPLRRSKHFTGYDVGEYEDAESFQRACELIFRLGNADDRPNGQYERSISVGDVVLLTLNDAGRPGRGIYGFACDDVGWRRLFCTCEWADDVGDPEVGPDPYMVEPDKDCPLHGRQVDPEGWDKAEEMDRAYAAAEAAQARKLGATEAETFGRTDDDHDDPKEYA